MTLVRFERTMPSAFDFSDVFGEFFNRAFSGTALTRLFQNAVNVYEDDKKVVLEIALPGVDKKDVDIQLNEDLLEIKVVRKEEREEKDENYIRREFDFTSFERSFHIPDSIDAKKIEAKFENGVLYVTLPKKQEVIVEPKKIKVK